MPPSRVALPADSALQVTIEYCSWYPHTLNPSTVEIELDNVDITNTFEHQLAVLPDCDGPDDSGMISTGTVDVSKGGVLAASIYTITLWFGNDVAYYSAPEPLRGAVVTAAGQYSSVRAVTVSDARFTVRNTGAVRDTFTVSSSCSGSAFQSSCSQSVFSVALDPEQSADVTLTYTSGSAGAAGTAWLKTARASAPSTTLDSTWTDVDVHAAPPAGVALVTAGATTARGLCLTIALDAASAAECGDLRVVHPLPTTTTMGRARAPTLIYNSQHAHLRPLVHADVTLPAGQPLPDTVRASVTVGGVQRGSGRWLGAQWGSTGSTRRIAFQLDSAFTTGLYDYTLQVTLIASGGGQIQYSANGSLPVVKRSDSPFGAGWWLAGLEDLLILDANRLFWVGGDGSTRLYTKDGGNPAVFRAPGIDRPDSITVSGGTYIRWTEDHGQVAFNSNGRHTTTQNRLGHLTRFQYQDSTTKQLWRIRVPTVSAGTLPYTFVYAGGGILTRVDAPPLTAGGGARQTRIRSTGARVDSIQDPDLTRVRYGYGTGANANVMVSRTDRRGIATSFLFDTAGRVIRRSLELQGGAIIRDSIAPAETRGVPGALHPTAQPLDSVHTTIDGPRTDVQDVTKIWLNALGAPLRVRNPLGRETRVWYDAVWPALVHRSQSPERLVSRAFFNARALPDSTHVYDPLGPGSGTALTRYTWHATYRMPTEITSPTGLITRFAYHAGTGTRSWQQVGTNSSRRVNFTYYTGTRLLSSVTVPLQGPDSLFYDPYGNLARTRSPLRYTTLTFRDAAGRDTLSFAPVDTSGRDSASVRANGAWTRTTYDLADRPLVIRSWGPPTPTGAGTLPADSVTVTNTYDAEGNLEDAVRTFIKAGTTYGIGTSWTYDNAGRVSAHAPAGTSAETYVLDPAGNVTQLYTRRGHILESSYDAAGQLVRSVVPQVSYPTIQCRNYSQCLLWSFPTRDPRPGVCIAADTARFRYDAAGRITAADNMYARVRRSYTPSGLMTTEQLAVRTYYRSAALNPCGEEAPKPQTVIPSLDWDFAQNVYTSTRAYDLEGRRTSLTHPLAGGTQLYTYNPTTGLPSRVDGITGDTTRLDRDVALRHWRTRYPGNVTEEMVFDTAGRVVQRTAASIGETVLRDAAGRVYEATVTPATGGSFAAVIRYNGLGAVVRATGVVPGTSLEEMDVDAIGNRHIHRVSGEIANNADRYRRSRYDSAARLDSLWTGATDPKPFSGYDFREHYLHDASGNVQHVWSQEVQCVGQCVIETEAVSYYGADEKLRVFNRQIGQGTSAPGGVYEEYRYDALGRRVLVRSRSTAPCATSACSSYIERVAWDGAQRLLEVRAPGKDNESSTNLNSDQAVGLATDNFPFGRVRYTHGPELDRPLAIIRENLQGHPTIVVAPHANWQGDYEVGTFMNGTLTTTCTGSSGCPIIGWPGHHTTADGEPVAGAPPGWYGGIISQSADQSGLQYMRNRYYDPRTGRFTQEDPIGLAGGLNLYGFAGGDPVNFSDPFGLCDDPTKPKCTTFAQAVVGAFHATVDRTIDAVADAGNRLASAFAGAGKWLAREAAIQVGLAATTEGVGNAARVVIGSRAAVRAGLGSLELSADATRAVDRIVRGRGASTWSVEALEGGGARIHGYVPGTNTVSGAIWEYRVDRAGRLESMMKQVYDAGGAIPGTLKIYR